MALWSQYFLYLHFVVLLVCSFGKSAFDAIYQFGDSVSDTGNEIRECASFCSFPPYGETLFHRPTGRCSDGFLIVDFLAKAFQIPLINPYLAREANFVHGVNFAVAGSTALNASFFAQMGITTTPPDDSSISLQLEWFKTHLRSNICSSQEECKNKLGRTLFVVGPTGANDYSAVFGAGLNGYNVVPNVIQIIKDAIKEVIVNGATHVLVPGYFRFGCYPNVLINPVASTIYDEFGCIKASNDFSEYHNTKVREVVEELQRQHPTVSVLYGDLDSAFGWLLRNAASLGFEKDEVLKTCCGNGNNVYNFDPTKPCGSVGVSSCPNPKKRVYWDGYHLTHQAYGYMASWLLEHNILAI